MQEHHSCRFKSQKEKMMQALNVNIINSIDLIDTINSTDLLNPVDLLKPVKSAANILNVNPVFKTAKTAIDNVIEPALNNLTSKKNNGINRFLEAYGDCV